MIDPTRPIQTTENPPRQCRLIGVLERVPGTKTLLLEVPRTDLSGRTVGRNELEITLQGKTTGFEGSALTFVNEPKRESGFYPLTPSGMPLSTRGRTVLSCAFLDYPETNTILEIVRIDGVPTEAKIHARS